MLQYDDLLAANLPELHTHFTDMGISPNQYDTAVPCLSLTFLCRSLPFLDLSLLPFAAFP